MITEAIEFSKKAINRVNPRTTWTVLGGLSLLYLAGNMSPTHASEPAQVWPTPTPSTIQIPEPNLVVRQYCSDVRVVVDVQGENFDMSILNEPLETEVIDAYTGKTVFTQPNPSRSDYLGLRFHSPAYDPSARIDGRFMYLELNRPYYVGVWPARRFTPMAIAGADLKITCPPFLTFSGLVEGVMGTPIRFMPRNP